jgi:hypothetical protein
MAIRTQIVEIPDDVADAEKIPYSQERTVINAEIAIEWLSTQVRNRSTTETTVNTYRADMRGGRWTFTAEAIKFDWYGHLIDGQHRLEALAGTLGDKEEVIIEVLVIRGMDPASQAAMDQGRRRQAGQQLDMQGYKNGMYLASVARTCHAIDEGHIWKAIRNSQMSNTAVEQWVAEHRAEMDLANNYHSGIRKIGAQPKISGAMLIQFARKDQRAAEEFFDFMCTGANLEPGSPILALRERFAKSQRTRERLSDRDTMGFYIQAWNAWRRGGRLHRIQRPKEEWTQRHFEIAP